MKSLFRRQLSLGGERTLVGAILPPSVGHIHGLLSLAFGSAADLLVFAGLCSSLVFDAVIKTIGKADLYGSTLKKLPLLHQYHPASTAIKARVLLLNSLTRDYSDLWEIGFEDAFVTDQWSTDTCENSTFSKLSSNWAYSYPLRDDFSRRQALIEIDVISSYSLGIALRELTSIYRVQFPVLRSYEADTWYDQNGRIVFTISRGLVGVGLPRSKKKGDPQPCWNDVQHLSEEAGYTGDETVTQVVMDDTLPGGPREKTIRYQAPWFRCDREKDYEVAWKHFEKRFAGQDRSESDA